MCEGVTTPRGTSTAYAVGTFPLHLTLSAVLGKHFPIDILSLPAYSYTYYCVAKYGKDDV
ncbi:hypothetical protein CV016_19885 [Yersinia kristensenii]|nr:hypothetical protein CV016_19885 [Yersinia kristensenii]